MLIFCFVFRNVSFQVSLSEKFIQRSLRLMTCAAADIWAWLATDVCKTMGHLGKAWSLGIAIKKILDSWAEILTLSRFEANLFQKICLAYRSGFVSESAAFNLKICPKRILSSLFRHFCRRALCAIILLSTPDTKIRAKAPLARSWTKLR